MTVYENIILYNFDEDEYTQYLYDLYAAKYNMLGLSQTNKFFIRNIADLKTFLYIENLRITKRPYESSSFNIAYDLPNIAIFLKLERFRTFIELYKDYIFNNVQNIKKYMMDNNQQITNEIEENGNHNDFNPEHCILYICHHITPELYDYFLYCGINFNTMQHREYKSNALLFAAQNNNIELVKHLIERHDFDPCYKNTNGYGITYFTKNTEILVYINEVLIKQNKMYKNIVLNYQNAVSKIKQLFFKSS